MPYSNCMRCDSCDGFPCIVHAKSDAEVLGVSPALEYADVELRTNTEAIRLNTEPRAARSPASSSSTPAPRRR